MTWRHVVFSILAMGLVACSDDGELVLTLNYDTGWKIDKLVVTIDDKSTVARPAPVVILPLLERWKGRVIDVTVTGLRNGEQLATGRVPLKVISADRSEASVTLSPGCGEWCVAGQAQCVANGIRTCERDGAGCMRWSAPVSCDAACSDGVCGDVCHDECQADSSICAGAAQRRACGQFDRDSCLDWSEPIACAEGSCQLGECNMAHACLSVCSVGATRCEQGGLATCVDAQGCGAWQVQPCASGVCEGGACAASCPSSCALRKVTEAVGVTAATRYGEYVYYLVGNQVMRAPLRGGVGTVVVSGVRNMWPGPQAIYYVDTAERLFELTMAVAPTSRLLWSLAGESVSGFDVNDETCVLTTAAEAGGRIRQLELSTGRELAAASVPHRDWLVSQVFAGHAPYVLLASAHRRPDGSVSAVSEGNYVLRDGQWVEVLQAVPRENAFVRIVGEHANVLYFTREYKPAGWGATIEFARSTSTGANLQILRNNVAARLRGVGDGWYWLDAGRFHWISRDGRYEAGPPLVLPEASEIREGYRDDAVVLVTAADRHGNSTVYQGPACSCARP